MQLSKIEVYIEVLPLNEQSEMSQGIPIAKICEIFTSFCGLVPVYFANSFGSIERNLHLSQRLP